MLKQLVAGFARKALVPCILMVAAALLLPSLSSGAFEKINMEVRIANFSQRHPKLLFTQVSSWHGRAKTRGNMFIVKYGDIRTVGFWMAWKDNSHDYGSYLKYRVADAATGKQLGTFHLKGVMVPYGLSVSLVQMDMPDLAVRPEPNGKEADPAWQHDPPTQIPGPDWVTALEPVQSIDVENGFWQNTFFSAAGILSPGVIHFVDRDSLPADIDLTATEVSSPQTAQRGSTIMIDYRVSNQGSGDAPASKIGFFLSRDQKLNQTWDRFVGEGSLGSIQAGGSSADAAPVYIPFDIPLGRYFVGAVADWTNAIAENREKNGALIASTSLIITHGCDQAYMKRILPKMTYDSMFLLTVKDDPTIKADPDIPGAAKAACFPDRFEAYNYESFLSVWSDTIKRSGTMVACTGDETNDKIELAAMFANFVQESGLNMGAWYYDNRPNPVPRYKLGLCKGIEDNCPTCAIYPADETYSKELCDKCIEDCINSGKPQADCASDGVGGLCEPCRRKPGRPDALCPKACKELDLTKTYADCNWDWACFYYPQAGRKYCGRGPIQLTYNDAYGKFSEFVFKGDRATLVKDPDLVATDHSLLFLSAMYWWNRPLYGNKPSSHAIISGEWKPTADDVKKNRGNDFATVILAINGALECNKGEPTKAAVQRAENFIEFLKILKVDKKAGDRGKSDCSKSVPWS
jgi:hypothetical protein